MEAQRRFAEFSKIALIANGKIPVSEESPVFNLFSARRDVARRLKDDDYSEQQRQHVLLVFEDINDEIREYLLL